MRDYFAADFRLEYSDIVRGFFRHMAWTFPTKVGLFLQVSDLFNKSQTFVTHLFSYFQDKGPTFCLDVTLVAVEHRAKSFGLQL
jgi:hypothetical protein